MTQNRFAKLANQVQQTQGNSQQRAQVLLNGICDQLTDSNNAQVQQYGQELREQETNLIRALQQS